MIVERDLAVPARDGAELRADVYRPDVGAPCPAVVGRTPYDKRRSTTPPAILDPDRATDAGFALVCQDVRGQPGTGSDFSPFRSEGSDGYDTIEWVAGQAWCDGRVTMAGRSYAGATQWLAAAEEPPHLEAIAPVVIGSNYFNGWIYQGGAFQLGFNLFWVQLMTGMRGSLEPHFRHLPLAEVPLLDESPAGRFYREWLEHPTEDDYWTRLAINRRYDRIRVPALNVGGWYDVFLGGTLENFARMRQEAGTDAAREGTRLVVGPWAHGTTFGQYPDHAFPEFGDEGAADVAELQLEFFRSVVDRDREQGPPVRIFVMGDNAWRDEDGWPLARAREERWFLRSGPDGEGLLSREPPGTEDPDGYEYDPRDPAPTIGGPTSLPARMMRTNSGPLDQRPVEERPDVLVYTSEPLERPLEVTGPLTVVLYAATTAPDTDFVAKLTDVWPDGTSRILAEGILRARFRESFAEPRPVEPGSVETYRIDLVATSNAFLPGHRIRVAVTSSSFPRFDRNANSGRPLGADREADLVPARQTIFHDEDRASHAVLPVVPR